MRRCLILSYAAGVILTSVSADDSFSDLLVTPTEAPSMLSLIATLGLNCLPHDSFSDKLLDHVDCWSEVTKMFAC